MRDPRNKLKPWGSERGREKWASGSLNGIETAEIRLVSHQMAEIIKSHSDADDLTGNSPFVVFESKTNKHLHILPLLRMGNTSENPVNAIFQLKKG
ncbi:hypothetical protein NPIL_14911 [Nephila pilipes]|uniref:Uncharacterized protein n=1 Tax=Nephila pilipes TaxID=299642 RepID=A0A8X6UDU5_NEPPI|nr:hypothetical protein NPIL_14911 [Nephila pilipes]